VLVGQHEGLADALARVGLAVPDGINPASLVQLKEFLDGRPSPLAARGFDQAAG
jgi:hypothetical protein